MGANEASSTDFTGVARVRKTPKVLLKLDVVITPLADVDDSKKSHAKLGGRLGTGFAFENRFRVVQFTPPGLASPVQFGSKITSASPESAQNPYRIGHAHGPAPNHATDSSFATFTDAVDNGWLLQEISNRLPLRICPGTTSFISITELASAPRRAAAAHGKHEQRLGQPDANWPEWYAPCMAAEQVGTELAA